MCVRVSEGPAETTGQIKEESAWSQRPGQVDQRPRQRTGQMRRRGQATGCILLPGAAAAVPRLACEEGDAGQAPEEDVTTKGRFLRRPISSLHSSAQLSRRRGRPLSRLIVLQEARRKPP
ncbi:unnamed protein product [Arctogadus glacialis]